MKRIGQTWAERINLTQKKKKERERENDRFFFHPPFHFPPLPMISAKLSEVRWSAKASKTAAHRLSASLPPLYHYLQSTLKGFFSLHWQERKEKGFTVSQSGSRATAMLMCSGAPVRAWPRWNGVYPKNERRGKGEGKRRFTTLIWFQFPTSKEEEKGKTRQGRFFYFIGG